MHDLVNISLSAVFGLISGFVGAVSAGGGLISISGLIFLGLPPTNAIATSRLDAFASDIAVFSRFNKAHLIKWNYVFPFSIIAIAGSFLGSQLLLQIDEQTLEKVVGILLLFLATALVFNKDFGSRAKRKGKKRHEVGVVALFLVYIYAGAFGGAAGFFLIYTLIYFFGMSFIQANANKKIFGVFSTTTALVVFTRAGVIDFHLGIPLAIGSMIGAYIGARTAVKQGNKLVRLAFLIMVVASAITLLY